MNETAECPQYSSSDHRPSFLLALPDVRSQRPCIWPVLAKQSLHRPLEFSQVRRGARRKFAAPQGTLGVADSQGGWQERGSSVCWVPNCLANSWRLTLSFRLPHGRGTSRAACSDGSGIIELENANDFNEYFSHTPLPWSMTKSHLLLTLKSIALAHRDSKKTHLSSDLTPPRQDSVWSDYK